MTIENKSGFVPVELKVLLLMDEVKEKTAGGIYLPQTARDREQQFMVNGICIAFGGNAFGDWGDPIPKIGDRLSIAAHAGRLHKGTDGRQYRVVLDSDIVGIIMAEENDG